MQHLTNWILAFVAGTLLGSFASGQVAVLLAITAGLLDEVPVDQIQPVADLQKRSRRCCSPIPQQNR